MLKRLTRSLDKKLQMALQKDSDRQPSSTLAPTPSAFPDQSAQPTSSSRSPLPTRTLYLQRPGGVFNTSLKILDSDSTTPLYSMDRTHKRLTITASSSSTPLAIVTFHGLNGCHPTIVHGDQPLTLTPSSPLARSFNFQTAIGSLTWRVNSGHGRRIILETATGEWIAKVETNILTRNGAGRIELANADIEGWALEEVVVTGMVMVEVQRRVRMHS
ncbi:MAG: hypothetical protein Q9213_004759 [Squamulea squamosa]